MRMLLVEDDKTLRRGLSDHFRDAGWEVISAADGELGLELAFREKIDVIVLDLMLPGIGGYEICKTLRREKVMTPILMLTAKGQIEDVVQGLDWGADDYLVKPFSLRVLDARVKVLVRRLDSGQREYEFGDCFCLDLRARTRTLELKGIQVALTPKGFDLLALFLRKAGRAMTRA